MNDPVTQCPRCAAPLPYGARVCPNCNMLVYAAQLNQLAAEAIAYEPTEPSVAVAIWRQCLDLLPPDSQQHADIAARINALAAGFAPPALPNGEAPVQQGDDPLPLALFKTIGSMALSIALYMWLFQWDWRLAVGFVLLILIHEMGHVMALRHYGYSASPPIFIPFMGALINLRQPPRNAWEEAVIGIGGPIAGTVGALACYAVWRVYPDNDTALTLAVFGFMLNFFNMLPVPPLDGGRITAAVSPWAWIAGLIAIVTWMVRDWLVTGRLSFIMILVLFVALPRIRDTLRSRELRNHPYYQIGRQASWLMGVMYISLTAVLAVFYFGNKARVFGD
jgi:Zn-dependent protease